MNESAQLSSRRQFFRDAFRAVATAAALSYAPSALCKPAVRELTDQETWDMLHHWLPEIRHYNCRTHIKLRAMTLGELADLEYDAKRDART